MFRLDIVTDYLFSGLRLSLVPRDGIRDRHPSYLVYPTPVYRFSLRSASCSWDRASWFSSVSAGRFDLPQLIWGGVPELPNRSFLFGGGEPAGAKTGDIACGYSPVKRSEGI